MSSTAKIVTLTNAQVVHLPLEFRFDCSEVYIRRDPATGDVVLSHRPDSWDGLFSLYETTQVPADFMSETDRSQGYLRREPIADSTQH